MHERETVESPYSDLPLYSWTSEQPTGLAIQGLAYSTRYSLSACSEKLASNDKGRSPLEEETISRDKRD